jgi:uncharacterized repeat protein (TIGR02543 family)
VGLAVVPDGVTNLGYGSFSNSIGLTSIEIPASVASIDSRAFDNATALTRITVDSASTNYSTIDGVLFTKSLATEELFKYPAAKGTSSYDVPTTVKKIGAFAFYKEKSLTSITIPSGVEVIGESSFEDSALEDVNFADGSSLVQIDDWGFGQTQIETVDIPVGVISIGDYAFYGATSLTSITIPASLTTIGDNAFEGASSLEVVAFASGSRLTNIGIAAFQYAYSLTSIAIPASVTSIEDNAFYGANSLTGVTFASGSRLTSIGDYAFYNSTALTTIAIPASVVSIGDSAFAIPFTDPPTPSSLTSVTFASGSQLSNIGSSAFANASALTSIAIPANVTDIGDYAFSGASSLATVTFVPTSKLTYIGQGAFYDASLLNTITIPASVTQIYSFAFDGASNLSTIYFLGNPSIAIADSAFDNTPEELVAYGIIGFAPEGAHGLTFEVGVYTATYSSTGGTSVTPSRFISGGQISLAPASPTRSGHTFAGWATTTTGTKISFPYRPVVTGDVTLYAKWTRNPVKAVATVKPKVSGTAKVGKKLTAKRGTWTGYPTPTYSYQWYACSKSVTSVKSKVPSTCKKISGATKSTIKLKSSQKKKYIAVLVTGTSKGTTKVAWLSKSTSKVK